MWGGGGGFCGEVRRYVFLSLLGRGLAGVLLLGFLAGGCACGRFCGEVRWWFWWALAGGNYACQLTVFHVESQPIFVCGALLFAWKVLRPQGIKFAVFLNASYMLVGEQRSVVNE